ncbi:MAG: phosphotransferase enzyme family protein [Bacteriovoracaceae bacterium]
MNTHALNKTIFPCLPFNSKRVIFHHKGENENFILRADNGQSFILKKYRQDRKQRLEIELEIELCKFLRKSGIIVPEYKTFKDGESVLFLDDHKYTIQEIVSGYMIYRPDDNHYYEIGKSYRKLHNLNLPPDLSSQLPSIDKDTISSAFHYIEENKTIDIDVVKKLSQFKNKAISNLDFSPKNLVHFDLHDGNMIYTPQGLCMIDWEECGLGSGVFDLAVSMTRLIKMNDSSSLIKALLHGYGKVDFEQLKYATIYKYIYLACFVAKFEDILKNESLGQLLTRYLGYFEKIENEISEEGLR